MYLIVDKDPSFYLRKSRKVSSKYFPLRHRSLRRDLMYMQFKFGM